MGGDGATCPHRVALVAAVRERGRKSIHKICRKISMDRRYDPQRICWSGSVERRTARHCATRFDCLCKRGHQALEEKREGERVQLTGGGGSGSLVRRFGHASGRDQSMRHYTGTS